MGIWYLFITGGFCHLFIHVLLCDIQANTKSVHVETSCATAKLQ